jgi:hypothetical protein
MAFSDNSKLDKSFKTLINKEFSTTAKAFYEEFGANTININTGEVWAENISSTPATAISNGVARQLTQFTLSPVAGFTTSVFYLVSGSGFTPGTTINRATVDTAQLQRNFIGDKYGTSYAAQLFDNAGNQIFPTDAIDWFFDYVTGILFVQDPGGYSTPYKITVYQYTGKTLTSSTLGYSGSFSGSFQGNGSGLTNLPASSIVGLNLTQIADSQVSASVSATGTPFTISSASVNLLTVDNSSKVTATTFSGSLIGVSNTTGSLTGSFTGIGSGLFSGSFQGDTVGTSNTTGSLTGSFSGVGSGSFSGSFQGNGGGLTNLPASSIVGLNLSQTATGSVSASVNVGATSFQVVSGSSTLLSLSNTGDLTVSGSEVIGNHITAKGNATITGSLAVNGITTLNSNLIVNTSSSLRDTTVTGSMLVTQNLTVLGTASFTRITGSEIIVGASTITLSTDDPVVRFGGILVIDSGSFGQDSTGSLLWDSEEDRWIYVSPSGSAEGYNSAILIGGPPNTGSIGDEPGLTPGRITKALADDHIGPSLMRETGSAMAIDGTLSLTGSTLLTAPDGTGAAKYALVASQSAWHYSDNVGYPVGTNQWGSDLNGSYFNTFTPNTDTATILRFVAGLLSSSAPAPSPNTRTYNTVTAGENSLGSTATVSVLSDQRLSLGYTSSGQISQAFKNTINYGIAKGWSAVGSENNGEGTQPWKLVGAAYYQNFSTYNFRFTSNASSGTGGNGSDFFGLDAFVPTEQDFKVRLIGSMSFSDTASITSPNASTGTVTQTKTLDFLKTRGTTTLDSNGLSLATIITANPAVIPNTFQDARFFEAGKVAFLTRSFGTSLAADNTVSSSGYYNFYGMQAGVTSGSATSYIFRTTSDISRLWLPITAIQTSMSATPAPITAGTFASSSLTLAPSRSYSGVPYLTAGTSTWTYLGTGSGMFDPAFLNGVVLRQSISETLPGTVLIDGSSNSDVSCNTLGIATAGKVYDATGNVKNSGLPRINDQVRSNVVITHSIEAGESNIAETAFSTGTTFTATTLGYTYTGSSGATLNTSTLPYHQAGTYGQPAASGSLGIYGGGTTNSVSVENFTSESFRRVISNSTTLTTQWNEATALTLGDGGDLQVKPSTTTGFLVNPESTKGYWYPQTGYSANHYKWFMREITTNAAANRGSITLDFDPNTSADFVAFDSTTTGKIALGLIFEAQVAGKGAGNVVMYDVIKGNGSYGGSLNNQASSTQLNPFSDNIDVQAAFSSISNSSGTITLGLNNPVNQIINGTYKKVWLLVRYRGVPANSLRKLTVTVG